MSAISHRQENSGADILIATRGNAGIVTLNRPQALNALTLEMIRQISGALQEWEKDDGIELICFRGTGPRAFCAGGDIKQFFHSGMNYRRGTAASLKVPAIFFGEEYRLNRAIFLCRKPTLAFMNGITMGGGYGIAGHCRIRIATEKTLFAMPETGIGFFPDVGAMYHLVRCPDQMGRYLALTGSRIGPGEMLACGLADRFISGADEDAFFAALEGGENCDAVLRKFSRPPPERELSMEHRKVIAGAFAHQDLSVIMEALAREKSDFARETLALIENRSPSSVAVAAEYYSRAAGMDFAEIIETDFILAQRFIERRDMYEGIRAAVIDKSHKPQWDPASLDMLGPDQAASYFTPTGYSLADISPEAGEGPKFGL